jgi:hypothetical protein
MKNKNKSKDANVFINKYNENNNVNEYKFILYDKNQ